MIEISFVDNFNPEMIRYERQVLNRVRTTISHWVRVVVTNAKKLAPKDTGFLASSIGGTVQFISRLQYSGVVWAKAPYAYEVEYGLAGPTYISFNDGIQGQRLRVWAKRHGFPVERMGGLTVSGKPQQFMTPAVMANQANAIASLNRVLRRY